MQCHGSFATASCTVCKLQVAADAIREDIFERRIPLCPRCKHSDGEGDSKEKSSPVVEPSTSPDEPSISGKPSTSSTGGEESDLEVPETSSANATMESCEKSSETPSYVPPKSVMKPDIVFFGEGLPDHFHQVGMHAENN